MKSLYKIVVSFKAIKKLNICFDQGFGRGTDENMVDLCLRSIVFSFESGRL